jgi:hypothetical protein
MVKFNLGVFCHNLKKKQWLKRKLVSNFLANRKSKCELKEDNLDAEPEQAKGKREQGKMIKEQKQRRN